jgi:U3 small nucleolar RNA-associated protein 21
LVQQSPAIDVVAIGLSDGRILLQNLRTGIILKEFHQEIPITTISFREDLSSRSTMVSASSEGHLMVWNLDEDKMIGKVEMAHEEKIHTAQFLPGQPILLTAGDDNAIKVRIILLMLSIYSFF